MTGRERKRTIEGYARIQTNRLPATSGASRHRKERIIVVSVRPRFGKPQRAFYGERETSSK